MKNTIKDFFKDIRYLCRDLIINRKYRKRLQNTNFSIISNDCTAGCIYKDLKIRMDSPTRNFYFNAKDYIKFCQNLHYYLNQPLQYDNEKVDEPYLTAKCGDIRLFLVHYESVEQAQEEWERRKKRVNFDNLYFMMNDRNYCTELEIKAFDELPYKNKICFTHVYYPQYLSTYYISGSEDKECLDTLTKYVHQWWIIRYYDFFDFVSWLNNK